ncbi:glycerate kinase [Calothrix sp. 336/3]|uniref:glycerate kinase n=1 Tax=Calothrix sp. 336/3 TaxID=1337936 RepID=UPI0004E3043C|nr:glycerate kinase [Calothrix sp. 336/3]AKG23858.1 glycerate kinase [Calothrix sp. 336/3]
MRSPIFNSVYSVVNEFCQTKLKIPPEQVSQRLEAIWLPIAMQIAEKRQKCQHPWIQGILGGQGTGKTTLCHILKLILESLDYHTETLSLDDLYKTYQDRLALQYQDPRLIWRGPPGTHDIDLGLSAIAQIRQGASSVEIPRFDKSAHQGAGDRTVPQVREKVDILLFEGWFVGVRPIDETAFAHPPSPIITEGDRQFARDMNRKLYDYLPLWQQLDSLIVLYPTDYRLSLEWRKQAEQEMIATGKSGMTDSQIDDFVNYFWRALHPELFIKSLIARTELVDLVVKIQPDRSLTIDS